MKKSRVSFSMNLEAEGYRLIQHGTRNVVLEGDVKIMATEDIYNLYLFS